MSAREAQAMQRADPPWGEAAQAMYRAAQAVSHPGGPGLFADLVRELAGILQAATVFIAVFTDESRSGLHTLAAVLDGKPLRNFDYPLEGSPCARVVGQVFRYVGRGVAVEFPPGTIFGAKGMDSYAAFPLNDSAGVPLGLLVAMDRQPVADASLAEALLKIFAGRIVAEIERGRADEALRAVALAVSSARGESIFAELARYLAAILRVEIAIIARYEPGDPDAMRIEAMVQDGQLQRDIRYRLKGTPCATVIGQQFRAYPSRLRELFPDDPDIHTQGAESYAGYPLRGLNGEPLGNISIASRQPLVHVERIESMLKIFAVRAAAEIEQQRARETLQRSVANYRAIFEAAEDAIFIHHWDTGGILDVNPKACETYGYTRDQFRHMSVADVSSGVPPFTPELALHQIGLAKLGRCPPFEWHRRNRDGSLHWDEVRLKPALIDGQPHILAFTREITERKRAEEALRTSEEQYRAIFDASADALILWDSQYRRVDVNPAYVRLFGWSRDEVIGRGWDRPDDGEEYAAPRRDLVRRALAGETCRRELAARCKDGTIIQIEVHATPFRHRGEPHVLAIARDITERRLADERLRAREEQYRAIFDGSVDPMVLWNRALQVVDVNAAFEQTTGMCRSDVVGRHWSERPDAEEMRRLVPVIERALAGGMTHTVESVTRADGSPFDIELRYLPVRLGGEPYVLGIGRDVTARLEQERALQRSEARLRATVEAAFDCVIGMDGEGRIVEWNAAAERCFGRRRETVLGRSLADVIIPPRHHETHAHMLKHFRPDSGAPMAGRLVETTALRADGMEIPVELAISVAAVPEGSIFVCHVRDLSARRAAEAERAALEAQLRQAQKMEAIGQLTGGIAHDFNNILTSVLGYLALGLQRASAFGDARLTRQLGQAELAAQRARDLVAQMLAFARRQRGERRTVALPELVRQSLQLLRPTLPASVVLDAMLVDAAAASPLPPVRVDAVQIEQVLFNLCINARDAMEGSGAIRVQLAEADGHGLNCSACGKAIGAGRWVELGVADTGHGIPPEVLRRMFEPFFTTKEIGRGSGMGLAMVHGIVHEHGGHLVVETVFGKGTSFRVLLPADDEADAEAGAGTGPARQAAAPLTGHVLVVEDEVMVGDFMAELLDDWGLHVVLMRDAAEALAWVEDGTQPLDLLITDQTMPQMTGLQLAGRCREQRPGLPVLLYTGNPGAIDASALERAGVQAVLAKPVAADALRDALIRSCVR